VAACPACGKENPDGFQFCGFCSLCTPDDGPVGGVVEIGTSEAETRVVELRCAGEPRAVIERVGCAVVLSDKGAVPSGIDAWWFDGA
jgi:hypothetical protein